MLNQKTRYTIRALQHLADRFGAGPIPLTEIADTQHIPRKFLTVILAEMGREGLVGAQRGRDGGYWLARPPASISYDELIRLTQGSLALLPCAARLAYRKCDNCVPEEECRLRAIMITVRDATAEILEGITLADPMPSVLAA